jgi:hypothetical protein
MLADQGAYGAYLSPRVQNTTHVTHKTNLNYGLFNSDIRWNIHILTSDPVTDFSRKQALFDLDRENNTPPPKTVSVSREHYGIILSDREADPTRGISALAPAFHNPISKTKDLRAWELCGAVPITRAALNHRSARGEVARNATIVREECFDPLASFRHQHAGMLEVESQNHKACLMLTQLGFKGDALKRCAIRHVDNLSARVSTMSSEEERVIA